MRVIITGASRGIGAAIAKVFAARHAGAQIALLGRSLSAPAHAALEGTLLETARDVEACGAAALPYAVDHRDADALAGTLRAALHALGGCDVLINNASALHVAPSASAKHMDLVHAVNARATLLCLDACADALRAAGGAVVTLAPPVRLGRLDWIRAHPPYTLSKYAMSLATLAAAGDGVRANCLWPRHTVATAATRHLEAQGGAAGAWTHGRDPHDVARAVHALAVERTAWNARCVLDDEVLPLPPTRAPLDLFVEPRALAHPLA